jgi:hypothetical protein
MTQDEAVAALTKTNETLVKVSNETDSLLKANEELQKALDQAQSGGGKITPQLEAAIKAIDTRAHAIDDLVQDVPQPETSRPGQGGAGVRHRPGEAGGGTQKK